MGKFRPLQYHPKQDSSPGTTPLIVKAGLDPNKTIALVQDDGACPCGCLSKPKGKGSTFAMGHDARLRGKLIRAHLMGFKVARIVAGKVHEESALVQAARHGWEWALEDAERKEMDRVQDQLRRANRDVLAKATGPQIGHRRLIKVGRWEHTGQIMALYHIEDGDGPEVELEYVTKKGEIKRIRKPFAETQEVAD